MERLTMEYEGLAVPKASVEYDEYDITSNCVGCGEECDNADGKCSECPIQHCLTKLKDYEDAEEQGLLLRLQFPIGQKVYFIYASAIDDTLMIGSMKYQYSCLDFPRVYYATREEAEKALEDMKGGKV